MAGNRRQQGDKKLRNKLFTQQTISKNVFVEVCNKTTISHQYFDLKTCINAIERLFLVDGKFTNTTMAALNRFLSMLENDTEIESSHIKDALNAINEYIANPQISKFYASHCNKIETFNQISLSTQLDLLKHLPLSKLAISDGRFETLKLTIATEPLLAYLSPKAQEIRHMLQTELTEAFDIHDTRFEIQRQRVIHIINQTPSSLTLQACFTLIKAEIPLKEDFENDPLAAKDRAIKCFVTAANDNDLTHKERCATTHMYIDKLASQLNVDHITYVKDILPKIVSFMQAKEQLYLLAQGFYDSYYAYDTAGAFHEDTSSCLSGVESRLIFCVWPLTNPDNEISYESALQTWLATQTQYFFTTQQPTPLLWSLMLEAYLDIYELKLKDDHTITTQAFMTDEMTEQPSDKTLVKHTIWRIESYLGAQNMHVKNLLVQNDKLLNLYQDPYTRSILQDILEAGEVADAYQNVFMHQDHIIEKFKEFIIDDKEKFLLTLDAWKESPSTILAKINNHQKVNYQHLMGYMGFINYISRDILDDIINEIWSTSDLAEALFTAVRLDLDEYTDMLIHKGAHIALEELFDTSVIILACQSQNMPLLKHLLTYPLDLNFKRQTDGMSALMYAARYFPQAVPLLITLHTSTDTQDHNGNTALHHAIKGSQNQSLKTLLKYNADSQIKNNQGEAPLHTAAHRTDWHGIDTLLVHDADPTIRDHDARNFAHILLAKRAYHTGLEDVIISHKLNRFDRHYNCLLHYALEQSHDDLCQALLEQGLSLFHPNPNHSCLDYLMRERKLSYIEHILYHQNLPHKQTLIKVMLFDAIRYQNRRYYNLISKELDYKQMYLNNRTALQYAYTQKFMHAVHDLINRHDPHYINISHATNPCILYMAVAESDESTVKACLCAGANADVLFDKKHMLAKAIENRHIKIIKKLLNYPHNQSWQSLLPMLIRADDAKVAKVVYAHFTPLNNHFNLLHALISADAMSLFRKSVMVCHNMIDEIDKQGRSPLILAVQKQSVPAVELLLDHNANKDIIDNQNHSAMHYANQSPHNEIKQLFQSAPTTTLD